MKKKDVTDFFEGLEVRYGPNLCSSFLKRNLESNFESIPKQGLSNILGLYEDIYKSSVIFRPDKKGLKAAEKYAKNIAVFLKGMHCMERRFVTLDSMINNLYKGTKKI